MFTRGVPCPSLLPPPVTGPIFRPTLPEDTLLYCPRLDFPARSAAGPAGAAASKPSESDSPAQQPFIEELDSRVNW